MTVHPNSSSFAKPDRMGQPDDQVCDICCKPEIADVIDGDRMCFACADRWARAQRPDDDLVPISTLRAMGLLPVRGMS